MISAEEGHQPQYYLDHLLESIEKYARQEITLKEYCNTWADYWRYYLGVNVIPVISNTDDPRPIVKWKEFQNIAIPEEVHTQWKNDGLFNTGNAVIAGKVWHRPDLAGYYFFGTDSDNRIATQELLTSSKNGKIITLEQFGQLTLVEQHDDAEHKMEKMHYYGYTIGKPLRDKTSDIGRPGMDPNAMPAFEVKASSKFLMYCSPNIHKSGYPLLPLRTLTPIILGDVEMAEQQEHFDSICKKYGLIYNGSGGVGDGPNNDQIPIQELFKEDCTIYQGNNRHGTILRAMDSLLRRNDGILSLVQIEQLARQWNDKHCEPPLDDREFNKQWNCAQEYIAGKKREEDNTENGDARENSTSGQKQRQHRSKQKVQQSDEEDQQQKEDKPKEYTVYKYGKGIPVAEQIILDNKSVFLQIIDGKPVISSELDLTEEQNIILHPYEHGISGAASPTLPIKFKNLTEIEYFINQAKNETIGSLFLRHKSLWGRLVVTQNESEIIFLAIDSMYSQFQDLFETTHYDLLYGDPGSGKGAKLITFKLLGYRVVLAADLSGANILDLYGSSEICQITIAEDEMDDIHKDADKHKIYKIGYGFTGTTQRTLDGSTSNRNLTLYTVFGLKIFGTENAPDDKKLGGFNDRTFRQPSIKGKAEFVVKKVLRIIQDEIPIDRQLPKYRKIVKEVDYTRKISLMFRIIHHEDLIEEVETNIDGRPLELTGPQIYLFTSRSMGSTYLDIPENERKDTLLEKEILPTLSLFLRQKGQLAKKTIESAVYDALRELMSKVDLKVIVDLTGKQTQLFTLSYESIYTKVKELTGSIQSTNPNEQAIYSDEYGKITHRQILKICRNRFLAENDTIGSMEDKIKALTFNKETVDKVGKAFEVVTKIEIIIQSQKDAEEDDIGTEGRNYPSYKDIGEKAENGPINQSNEREEPQYTEDGDKENSLSTCTDQNSVPPSLNTEITHENESKHRDGIGTEFNDKNSVPPDIKLESEPTNEVKPDREISRLYGDIYGCSKCNIKDDRFAMQDHVCGRPKK